MERGETAQIVHGRFDGRAYRLEISGVSAAYSGDGFDVRFAMDDPFGTIDGDASVPVDLTFYAIMNELRKAIFEDGAAVNYVNA